MTTYGIPYFDHGDDRPASLPYAGTSGWSGSEASRLRAEERDSSGKTRLLQSLVEEYVKDGGEYGATIHEVREAFPDHHHGSLSGTLTDLHKDGRIARLADRRGKCSIYVDPAEVRERKTAAPTAKKPKVRTIEINPDEDAELVGHQVLAALLNQDRVIVKVP